MVNGILLPLITPFKDNGDVDEEVLLFLTDAAIQAGVHGIFLLGSQGQGPTMSVDERMRTTARVAEHIKGRVPLIVHVGTTHLRSTIQLARQAEASGADAIAAIPPYYYSDHLPAEIDAHLIGVSEATSLPIILYNNAKYAGVNITPEWLARLADQMPMLRGVKLSYANPEQMLRYVEQAPSRVAVYSGSTMYLLSTVPFGVSGAINPPSVLFPELAVTIWDAIVKKEWELAFQLQDRVNRVSLGIQGLVGKYGRAVYREGLCMKGFDVKVFPRWESAELPAAVRGELKDILDLASISSLPQKTF